MTAENQEQKKDGGKAPIMRGLFNYFPRALERVAQVSAFGHQKYKEWGGWRNVDNGHVRYSDAFTRHIIAEARGETVDQESGLHHDEHAAWNVLARLELRLIAEENAAKTQGAPHCACGLSCECAWINGKPAHGCPNYRV